MPLRPDMPLGGEGFVPAYGDEMMQDEEQRHQFEMQQYELEERRRLEREEELKLDERYRKFL